MKKISVLLLLIAISSSVSAQLFYGSIIAGGNVTQVDGDKVFGYRKIGVNVGASVMMPLNKKQTWFATVELLYNQKGSRMKNGGAMMDTSDMDMSLVNRSFERDMNIKYFLKLDYVEIPILFHYEDIKTGWAFGAGVAWARLVNIREIENGFRLITDLNSGTYTKNDWSAIADVKMRIYKGLKLNFRFQYSFVPIRTRIFTKTEIVERKQRSNILTLRLIYCFNEKFKLNENKKGEISKPKWIRDIKTN